MVSVRGAVAARRGRGHRLGGVARVRRRNGQRPHTWPVGPDSAAQLRRGPAVLVLGRLAAQRLHRAHRGADQRVRHLRHTIAVPARIALLSDAGRTAGRRGQVSVDTEDLHGRRATIRTRGRQKFRVERKVYC